MGKNVRTDNWKAVLLNYLLSSCSLAPLHVFVRQQSKSTQFAHAKPVPCLVQLGQHNSEGASAVPHTQTAVYLLTIHWITYRVAACGLSVC